MNITIIDKDKYFLKYKGMIFKIYKFDFDFISTLLNKKYTTEQIMNIWLKK